MRTLWLLKNEPEFTLLIERKKIISNQVFADCVYQSPNQIEWQIKNALQYMNKQYILQNHIYFSGKRCGLLIQNANLLDEKLRSYLEHYSVGTMESNIRNFHFLHYLLLSSMMLSQNPTVSETPTMAYSPELGSLFSNNSFITSDFTKHIVVENDGIFNSKYSISSRMTETRWEELLNSKAGQYFKKYASYYLNDEALPMAIAMQESGFHHQEFVPGGEYYHGYSIGIGQLGDAPINAWKEETFTAYNYVTKQLDEEILSVENACNLETNIKLMTMRLQMLLKEFEYNPYATIQAYNYGPVLMEKIIGRYAEDQGLTKQAVLQNINDLGWISYVKQQYRNPSTFVSNWSGSTYGDGNYIEHVLSYFPKSELTLYQMTPQILFEQNQPIEKPASLSLQNVIWK